MLALVGSGEYLPSIETVDRELIARLGGNPQVVCLPTAAGTEGQERINYWSHLGVDHFARLGVEVQAVPVVDKKSANNADFAAQVRAANFVYLSGGKPSYLYDTMRDSLVWKAILSVLDQGGLLAGCSAGAMIMGEKFFGFPGWKPGFGFLSGMTVLPHYDEISEMVIAPARQVLGYGLTILGIEGNTALVKDGNRYEVLGTGGVTVWNNHRKVRYTSGVINID